MTRAAHRGTWWAVAAMATLLTVVVAGCGGSRSGVPARVTLPGWQLMPQMPALSGPLYGTVSVLGQEKQTDRTAVWSERTTDGGRTWSAAPTGPDATDRLFATASEGWAWGPTTALNATTDGGRTWTAVLPGWSAEAVAAAPRGSTWIVAERGCEQRAGCDVRLFEAGPGRAPQPAPVQPPGLQDFEQLVHPTPSQAMLLVDGPVGSRLEVTDDAGRTWRYRPLPRVRRPAHTRAAQIVDLAAVGAHCLWVEAWQSVGLTDASAGYVTFFASVNGGRTWEQRGPRHSFGYATGPTAAAGLQLVSRTSAWYVAYDDQHASAIWRTTDGGTTWRMVFAEARPSPHLEQPVALVAVSALRAFVSAEYWSRTGSEAEVARTVDGGQHWSYAALPVPGGFR